MTRPRDHTHGADVIARGVERNYSVETRQPDLTAGACVGEAPAHHDDPDPWHDDTEAADTEAKAVCDTCPVLDACRTWIMAAEGGAGLTSRAGVWGGLTARERHSRWRAEYRRRYNVRLSDGLVHVDDRLVDHIRALMAAGWTPWRIGTESNTSSSPRSILAGQKVCRQGTYEAIMSLRVPVAQGLVSA
jgi:WhiB family redox-sensing transcriptional regulator